VKPGRERVRQKTLALAAGVIKAIFTYNLQLIKPYSLLAT